MRCTELIASSLHNHSGIGGQLGQPSLIRYRNKAGLLQRRACAACLPESNEL